MYIDLLIYSVDLTPPLSKREGLLLRLHLDGTYLFAEASPLPHWSHETLQDVIEECKALLNKNSLTLLDLVKALHHTKLPSLQFALESLINQLQKKIESPLQSQLLQVQGICFRNELVQDDLIDNFSTWKVKIGSLAEWQKIAPRFESAQYIRLDANQTLQASDVKLLHACKANLEFIEEPGEEFHEELERTTDKHPIYFALDESLRRPGIIPKRANHTHCVAYIFKPTLHGKRSSYECLALKAYELGKEVVMSSSIESPVGLYQIASLRDNFSRGTPWGLGTYRFFPEDFCEPFPKITGRGLVEFSPIVWVNEKYLRKVK